MADSYLTLAADYEVSTRVHPAAGASLDEVLLVTAFDRSSGEIVYEGQLSELHFRGTGPLPPGESASYVLSIAWSNSGTDDDAYQGQALRFDLLLEAESAAG